MLCGINEFNAVLTRKIDKLERHNSTPINPRSHTPGQPSSSPHSVSTQAAVHPMDIPNQIRDPMGIFRVPGRCIHCQVPLLLVILSRTRSGTHFGALAVISSFSLEKRVTSERHEAIIPKCRL